MRLPLGDVGGVPDRGGRGLAAAGVGEVAAAWADKLRLCHDYLFECVPPVADVVARGGVTTPSVSGWHGQER